MEPLLVGQQVNLGRQASSGTPQSLVGALFLRPVGRLLMRPHVISIADHLHR